MFVLSEGMTVLIVQLSRVNGIFIGKALLIWFGKSIQAVDGGRAS